MIISKYKLQDIVDHLPETIDVEEVFDKILISVKIDNALQESEKGLGDDWEDFKREWQEE